MVNCWHSFIRFFLSFGINARVYDTGYQWLTWAIYILDGYKKCSMQIIHTRHADYQSDSVTQIIVVVIFNDSRKNTENRKAKWKEIITHA